MNCKHAQKLISKSVDGLMNPSEKALLDRHLAQCPRCSEEHADLVSLDCLLSKALPLQETLGDGFAARVAEKLPARGSRLSILKEAFLMSRIKYAVLAAVVVAIAIGYLFAPHSNDSQALAAVQSAMARVVSMHYTLKFAIRGNPNKNPNNDVEVWSTPDATKWVRTHGGWTIDRDGAQFDYLQQYKALLITPMPESRIGAQFDSIVDPRHFADTHDEWSSRETVEEVETDGKPMLRIEIEWNRRLKRSEKSIKLNERWLKVITDIASRHRPSHRGRTRMVVTRGGTRSKAIVLVDPSTNLVQSTSLYVPDREGGGWKLLGTIPSIDYNVPLPRDFFDIKTPPGTHTYDLRDDPRLKKPATR